MTDTTWPQTLDDRLCAPDSGVAGPGSGQRGLRVSAPLQKGPWSASSLGLSWQTEDRRGERVLAVCAPLTSRWPEADALGLGKDPPTPPRETANICEQRSEPLTSSCPVDTNEQVAEHSPVTQGDSPPMTAPGERPASQDAPAPSMQGGTGRHCPAGQGNGARASLGSVPWRPLLSHCASCHVERARERPRAAGSAPSPARPPTMGG